LSKDVLTNVKLAVLNERSHSSDNLAKAYKRESSLENLKKGINLERLRKSSLERIEENKAELDEDISIRKTKSDMSNDIFKQQENFQASPRNINAFKIEQIKERMRKLSSHNINN